MGKCAKAFAAKEVIVSGVVTTVGMGAGTHLSAVEGVVKAAKHDIIHEFNLENVVAHEESH